MKKENSAIKTCRRHSLLTHLRHRTDYIGNSSAANCLGGAASFLSVISDHVSTLQANKKSQIKMFENIAVLIVFMFLLVFGANFYFFVQQNTIQKQAAEFRQLDAINVALNTLLMPELDCNFLGNQQQKCFDREKVRQFTTLLKTNRAAQHYYENALGTANITINILYPTKENIILYENTPAKTEQIGGIKIIQIPLIICEKFCDRINGEPAYSFAYINVEAYQRKT